MPEQLNTYILQERPITPGLDLGIVQNTLATITAGNKEALQTQSALRTAIAEMDLNEAEDGFRQALYDDISKTVEDNAIEGNAYYALDDIIKKQGDIASNPGLLGRLKAQQAYKQYRTQIDSRNDINQDTKEWAKALNPYHYEDKVDESGRIIGGSEWFPDMVPVSDVDFNDVLKLAAQYTTSDAGGETSISFLDANGRPTDKPTDSIGRLSTTGQWERLTPDKLRAGVYAAMNANPEYSAGLHQAYKVLEWKWENGDKNTALFDPKTNGKKGFNQYLDDMINPFLRARAYNHSKSTTEYHDAAFSALSRDNGTKDNRFINPNQGQLPLSIGHNIQWTDDTRQRALAQIDYVKSNILDLIAKEDPNSVVDPNMINIRDSKAMTEYLTKSGINPSTVENIVTYTEKQVQDNKQYYDYYDRLLSENTKGSAASIMYDSIKAGVDVSSDFIQSNSYVEKYNKQYQELLNSSFGDKNNFGFRIKDAKEYERLIGRLGVDETAVARLGYNITKDGKSYIISIDREHGNLYGQFMDAISDTHDETSWWNRRISQSDKFVTFNDDEKPNVVAYHSEIGMNFYYTPLASYNDFINKLNRNKDSLNNPETRLVGGTNIPGINPKQYRALEGKYNAQSTQEFNYYNDLDKAVKDVIEYFIDPANFTSSEVYSMNENNGTLMRMNSADKQILSNLIDGNADKLKYSQFFNPAEGKITPQFVYKFSGKNNDVNPFTKDATPLVFTADRLLLDPEIQNLNGSLEYATSSEFYRNNLNNINTYFGYYKDYINNDYIHYSFTPVKSSLNGTNYRDLVTSTGSTVLQNVDENTAHYIFNLFQQIKFYAEELHNPINGENAAIELNKILSENPVIKQIGEDIVNKMINTYSQ